MAITVLDSHRPIRASHSMAVARCFRIVTTQHAPTFGQTWRVTDAPHAIEVLEEDGAWHAYSPIVRTEGETLEQRAQLGERSTTLIISTQDDASFDEDDGRRGLLDSALVHEFQVDWRYWHLPPMRAFRWRVGDYRPESTRVALNLVGITGDLRRDAGVAFQPGCTNEFLDPRTCDLNGDLSGRVALGFDRGFRAFTVNRGLMAAHTRKAFTIKENVYSFPSNARTVPSWLTADTWTGWYGSGLVYMTSGRNVGVKAVVESNTTPTVNGAFYETTLTLTTPLAWAPEDGDTIDLRVGCDRAGGTCHGKFANRDNFVGFDLQPGSDLIKKTPEAT